MHNRGMTLHDYLSGSRLTNTEFAALVGVNQANISRLRRGKFSPTLDLMTRIAKATDGKVTPNDFMARETSPTPEPAPC